MASLSLNVDDIVALYQQLSEEEQEEFKKFTEEEYRKVRRTKSEPVMLSRTIKP